MCFSCRHCSRLRRPSFRLSGCCGATATAWQAADLLAQATRRAASRWRVWESTEISGLSWIWADVCPVFCYRGTVASRRRRHCYFQAIWQGVIGETFVSLLGLQGRVMWYCCGVNLLQLAWAHRGVCQFCPLNLNVGPAQVNQNSS